MKRLARDVFIAVLLIVAATAGVLVFIEDLCAYECKIPKIFFISATIILTAAAIVLCLILASQFSKKLANAVSIISWGLALVLVSNILLLITSLVETSGSKAMNAMIVEKGAMALAAVLGVIGLYRINAIISKAREK
ncbi:MAG: hypothetical protein R6U32_04515 [Candidatus Woesearchaeota archaeon]